MSREFKSKAQYILETYNPKSLPEFIKHCFDTYNEEFTPLNLDMLKQQVEEMIETQRDLEWREPRNYKEVSGYVLCSRYSHKTGKYKAISNSGIKGDFEIMVVSKETDTHFYGIPLEGLGLLDCMISKRDCRPFTKEELDSWQNRQMGIHGSHSGKLSRTFEVSINDLLRKEV